LNAESEGFEVDVFDYAEHSEPQQQYAGADKSELVGGPGADGEHKKGGAA